MRKGLFPVRGDRPDQRETTPGDQSSFLSPIHGAFSFSLETSSPGGVVNLIRTFRLRFIKFGTELSELDYGEI